MANNCYYQAQITGRAEDIRELIMMMKWKGKYENDGLGRVFDISCTDMIRDTGDKVTVFIEGDCAWSILSSMIGCASKRNLYTETKALNLRFEAYSEELGVGFQEHIVIDCGNLIVNDCVDTATYNLDELSPEEIEKICEENQFTKEEMIAKAEDGFYTVGGFKNWIFANPPTRENE